MTQRATISTVSGRAAAAAAGVAILAVAVACASAPTGGEGTPQVRATASECVPLPPGEEDEPLVETRASNIPGYQTLLTTQDFEYICMEVPVDIELAWGVLPGIYQEIGIPVATSDPTKRMVANPGFEVQRIAGSRMNRWLDCGTSRTGPMANAYQVTLTVETRLGEAAEGTTEVKSLVTGEALNRSTASFPVPCASRETLEVVIADKIAEALGAG
ncbi:MAG: hypothetical protein OXG58_12135 [Gemmatimonadetes bacterium]|nr:hypothetical protein [Gemmatimonadota bacterium]